MNCFDKTCYYVIGSSVLAAILLIAVVICCIVCCAKRRKRLKNQKDSANKKHDEGSRGGVTITEYDLNEEDKTSLNATENETDPMYDDPITIVRKRAPTGDLYTVPQKKTTVVEGKENNGPETKNPNIIEKDSEQSLDRDTNTPSTEKQINEDDKLNEPIYQDPSTIQRERAPTGDIYTLPQRKPSSKTKKPLEAKPNIKKKENVKASSKEQKNVCKMIESSITADDTAPPPILAYNGPPLDSKEQTDSAGKMLGKKKPVTLLLTTIGDSEYAEIQ